MEYNIRRLMMPDIAFHKTSTSPISLKLVHTPLGIITTVLQAHGAASSPPLKSACMMATNFSQFPLSGCSSRVAAQSYILKCSTLMPDGPPAQCICIHSTESIIYSSPRILSSNGKGDTSIGIG